MTGQEMKIVLFLRELPGKLAAGAPVGKGVFCLLHLKVFAPFR